MTFNSKFLYNILKPKSDPELITQYKVFIGGTVQVADYFNGAIIISLLNSKPLTSSSKFWDGENKIFVEKSLIQRNYQIDIYKKNSQNVQVMEVEVEAEKIREWLKSFTVMEYLQSIGGSGILPNYKPINYTFEQINEEFINRAFFDFSITTFETIYESTPWAHDAQIKNILLGD